MKSTARDLPGHSSASPIDVRQVRELFPVLRRLVNGRPLVYLDSAATNQKPQNVIDAVADFYSRYNSNVHRGVHALSQEATGVFEGAREKLRWAVPDDVVRLKAPRPPEKLNVPSPPAVFLMMLMVPLAALV